MFGDDIIVPSTLKDLVKTFSKKKSSIIALEKIPLSKVSSYGIVKSASKASATSPEPIEILDLVEKPSPKKAPSNLGIIGKYVVTKEILSELKTIKKSKNKEIRLIDGFKKLLKKQKIFGVIIKGKRYDTGTIDGYKKAISAS
jgi:UTP--glucose-1-phosphate uridylyltransferase